MEAGPSDHQTDTKQGTALADAAVRRGHRENQFGQRHQSVFCIILLPWSSRSRLSPEARPGTFAVPLAEFVAPWAASDRRSNDQADLDITEGATGGVAQTCAWMANSSVRLRSGRSFHPDPRSPDGNRGLRGAARRGADRCGATGNAGSDSGMVDRPKGLAEGGCGDVALGVTAQMVVVSEDQSE